MTSDHVGGPKCRKPDALRRRRGFRGSGRGKGDPPKGGGGKPEKGGRGGAKAVGAAAVDFLQRGAMGPPSRSLGKRTQREDRQEGGGGGGKTRSRGSASRETGQSVATDWEELADAEGAEEERVEEDLTHSPA
jgi:hypothetical protein